MLEFFNYVMTIIVLFLLILRNCSDPKYLSEMFVVFSTDIGVVEIHG